MSGSHPFSFFVGAMVHIGRLIHQELKRQGRTVTWFARRLGMDRTNAYKIFAKPTLDTGLLLRISLILGHDFFRLYSDIIHSNCRHIGDTFADTSAT